MDDTIYKYHIIEVWKKHDGLPSFVRFTRSQRDGEERTLMLRLLKQMGLGKFKSFWKNVVETKVTWQKWPS